MGVNGIHNINYVQASGTEQSKSHQGVKEANQNFGELFQGKVKDSLYFSKHAAKRMDERGISLDNQLLGNLEHVVEEARKKGSRDIAVIGSQGVFIVNVPNNTVVTTMSQEDMKDRIFTNIDSAVLM